MLKNLLLVFAFILVFAGSGHSQSLAVTPSDTLTIDTTLLSGQELIMVNGIKNNTASDSLFNWKVTYNSLPHQWTVSYCDPHLCHTNINGTLSYLLSTNSTGTMQLDLTVASISSCPVTFQILTWATGDSVNTATYLTYKVCATVNPNGIIETEAPQTSIYPNPVNRDLTVSLSQNLDNGQIEIFNLLGSRVYAQPISNGETVKEFDLSTLDAGLYIARISDGGRVIATKKFTKD
jgi:hypothetical protein